MSYEILSGLDGFGMLDGIAEEAKGMWPVAVGAVTAVAGAELADYFLFDTYPEVKTYKHLIGAAASILVGLGIWKFGKNESAGVQCALGGALTSLAVWGTKYIEANYLPKNQLIDPLIDPPTSGLGRYIVGRPQPVFQGRYIVGRPQPVFQGRYVVEQGQPLLAGMGAVVPNEVVNPSLMV